MVLFAIFLNISLEIYTLLLKCSATHISNE